MADEKGLIFDIQRYSIHDGPGIRTVIFFKGCPLRCKWCANPESLSPNQQIGYNSKNCIGCERCVQACENDAVSMTENGIKIDRSKCKNSFDCVKACPTGAMTLFGKWYTVDEVMDEALKDEVFYKTSGGGITLSGGEVLQQSGFASELLKKAKQRGLNTAIETSGFARWESFEKVLKYTDLILYDLKHIDRDMHIKYTGVNNRQILDNLKKVVELGKKVIVRIPMIPGVNMDTETIDGFIKILKSLGIEEAELLAFHQLGKSKYDMLDMEYTFKDVRPPEDADIKAAAERMRMEGINVKTSV